MKYVDILYVHGPSSAAEVLSPATLDALTSAKESGKARHVGVSTHKNEPEVIRAAAGSGVYDVVLTSINFKQDHFSELSKAIGEAAAAGVGIIAMKTMAGGVPRQREEETRELHGRAEVGAAGSERHDGDPRYHDV